MGCADADTVQVSQQLQLRRSESFGLSCPESYDEGIQEYPSRPGGSAITH